jgi:hypothetical protein
MAVGDCINFDLTTNPWTGYKPFESAVSNNFKVSKILTSEMI